MAKPLCYMCGESTGKRAKAHKITHPSGKEYYYKSAYETGAVFCSQRCAAVWGLSHFDDYYGCALHWCDALGVWEPCEDYRCGNCNPKSKESDNG